MNKFKKALALICCAVLLVCISVGATLAYLTSKTEVVQNTFTVGDVNIKLDEAPVDEYGKVVEGDRVIANKYKLMPGHTYTKDPTVTVLAGSEESYIRMFVTITDLADVKAAFNVPAGEYFLPQYFVDDSWDSDIWLTTNVVNEAEDGSSATYEFRYWKTVNTLKAADEEEAKDLVLEPLFERIKVPGEIDNDTLATLSEMEINIVAYAIQSDGFKNADEAWAAYDMEGELPVEPTPVPSTNP